MQCSTPAWQRARVRRSGSVDAQALLQQSQARDRLLAALQASQLWDAQAALLRLQGSELWQETVVVHQRVRGTEFKTSMNVQVG